MSASRIPNTPRTVDRLQSLVERLSAPDLTMAESQDLRPILLGLLDSIEVERAGRQDNAVSREPERRVRV